MKHRPEIEHAAQDGRPLPGGAWQHNTSTVDPEAIIFPGAYIGPNVTIGPDTIIGPNASIGQPGFGYTAHENGRQEYRSHTKGVVIEPDVHIGAGTCIDQGRHRPTIIRTGTRIDNLVHIAHNVIIGRHCTVIAHAMLAGTAELKDLAYVAPGAQVTDHATIGHASMAGLGAVVLNDIPDGETWVGIPARPIKRDAKQQHI